MRDYVTDVVVKSCVASHNDVHLLADGHPTSNQAHCTFYGLEPSYKSTYQEVHKADFEWLRGLVQTPKSYSFMHMDLTWATQIRAKGRRDSPKNHAPISVLYIPWARMHDFVKGEEALVPASLSVMAFHQTNNSGGALAKT